MLAHGGAVGLAIEISIIVGGLAALAAAVFVGARRKVDEYDVSRAEAGADEARAPEQPR